MSEESFIHNEEEKLEKTYDSKLMMRLLSYAKKYWKFFAIAIIMLLASTIADLARPYFAKIAIDDYLNGYNKPMIAYSMPSAEKGIEFEGTIYKRVNKVPSDIPESRIFTVTYIDKKPYLVNGLVKTDNKLSVTITNTAQGATYVQDGKSMPAKALTKDEIKLFRASDIQNMGRIGLIYILIILLGFGFNFLQIYVLSYAGQTIIFNLRQEVFSHLQKLPLSYFDKNPVGRLVTRVTNDTETLNEMYTNVLVSLIKDVAIFTGAIVLMFTLNKALTLIVLATTPFVIVSTILFRVKARDVYRRVRTTLAHINSTLSENISGIRVIQIFSKEKQNFKEFEKINKEYYKAGIDEVVVFGIFRPLIEMLSVLAIAMVIWYGGIRVIDASLQFGVLFAFVNYIGLFFQPINDLAEKFNILQSSMAASERIFQIIDIPVEVDEGKQIKDSEGLKSDIEFKNVWFAYKDEEWVLRDVSFKVPQGKTIAIVGATGAGKSSIINLINRFYEIQKGEIAIGGTDVRNIKKDDLRRSVAIVQQDVFLFSGTIKDNVRLNEQDISDEELKQACEYVNADKFIQKLASGYDEAVVERGATLSAGQRQLLAFARALAFNPSILILDEATASIDTETEILIQDALTRLTKDRTTIIVAHRLSTIKRADSIIVLHKGKIKEVGSHQELLDKKGVYYNLYQLQYKGA